MEPVKVGLVQINNSFSGQNYFPYSVGMLEAYARAHLKRPGDFSFILPVYSRIQVAEAVERLKGADVVAFSAYVWNIQISLEVARRLKLERPECIILFGGPQVPDRTEAFLREHRFIDVACNGEGERAFTELLDRFAENGVKSEFKGLKSLSYLDAGGNYIQTERLERLKEISEIPSPYLSGVFDPLMRAFPEEHWIGMWETNRGCPFACTFCDWGSATASRVNKFEIQRLYEELDWFAEKRVEFIFCADANFGMLPRDVDLVRYAASVKKKTGYPHAISVQNTKNATERAYEVQKLLSDAGMNKGVTISLQSMDETTLKAIKRDNISMDMYQTLQRRFAAQGVKTYTDVILGMPGETYETLANGVDKIIENGQHNRIQFNNLSILPNAEMGDPDYMREHGLETVRSRIINFHGAMSEENEIDEMQELVIGTNAMPKSDWVRTRAFCWWAALLHFDKVLQIPLIIARHQAGTSYRTMFEAFSENTDKRFPVVSRIRDFFLEKARDIQSGGVEYCEGELLKIWWPADELALIRMCHADELKAFYDEAAEILIAAVSGSGGNVDQGLLQEAITLNRELIKRPFISEDTSVDLEHNVWEYYQGVVCLTPRELEKKGNRVHIDRTSKRWSSWEDWCREVIWWGNKQGAYLYGTSTTETEIAGHY